MAALLIWLCLSADFYQKWYLPCGLASGIGGRVSIQDTDRDGNPELYICRYYNSSKVHVYELQVPSTWVRDSITCLHGPLLWDVGDYDRDGLYDFLVDAATDSSGLYMVMSIFESPDSFSYPTQEVWRDTVGSGLVQPISVYDINQDSYPEIIKLGWSKIDSITVYHPFGIYEASGNNQYDTVFMSNTNPINELCSTIAFGDFDLDSFNEFTVGNNGGYYEHWECIGGNNYQRNDFQQLPTVNIKDCFSVPDADRDGKPEFVVKGFRVGGTVDAYIFEAVANDTYTIIGEFHPQAGDYYGGYTEAGDVDGDSVPEIVLEARQRVYIIKAGGYDSFYIWDTLPGHVAGSCVRIFDLDGNGWNDIIISGGNETRIYEYNPNSIADMPVAHQKNDMTIFPNPFQKQVCIRLPFNIMGDLTFKVYDCSGCLVRNIGINKPAMFLNWDGRDNCGYIMGPGVYMVLINGKSGGWIRTCKIVKTK